MLERFEPFGLYGSTGRLMMYDAKFVNDIFISVTKRGAKKPMSDVGGKRLYTGYQTGYRLAPDIWGKAHTVHPKVKRELSAESKRRQRVGLPKIRQKLRRGGRPSTKAPKKDIDKSRSGKRYWLIVHRIQDIRECSVKEAFKVYRYLKTVCGGEPDEDTPYGIVKISRAVSLPELVVTHVFHDEQSPQFLFGEEEDTLRATYLRAYTPEITYSDVIRQMPDISWLEFQWSQHPMINTDNMVYLGLAADDKLVP